MDGVSEQFKIIYKKKLRKLHTSLNRLLLESLKSKRLRLAGHVATEEEEMDTNF
jgi:hypothetical protein